MISRASNDVTDTVAAELLATGGVSRERRQGRGELGAGQRALAVEAAVAQAREQAAAATSSCWSRFQLARVAAFALDAAVSIATKASNGMRRRIGMCSAETRAAVERCGKMASGGAHDRAHPAVDLRRVPVLSTVNAPPLFSRVAIGLCAAEFLAVIVWRAGGLHRPGLLDSVARGTRPPPALDIPALTLLMFVLATAYGLRVARSW